MKFISKAGRLYGRLLVVRRLDNNKHNQVEYYCQCTCGNTCIVTGCNLGRSSTSCGCLRRERAIETNSLRRYEALYRVLTRTQSGHRVELSYEDFLTFTEINECHYCGAEIYWAAFVAKGTAYNLDRKDTTGSYSKDNCVVCCKRCNIGKGRLFTYEQWKQIGALIRSWRTKK